MKTETRRRTTQKVLPHNCLGIKNRGKSRRADSLRPILDAAVKEAAFGSAAVKILRHAGGVRPGNKFFGEAGQSLPQRALTGSTHAGKLATNPHYGLLRRRPGTKPGSRKLDKTRHALGKSRQYGIYGSLGFSLYELLNSIQSGLGSVFDIPANLLAAAIGDDSTATSAARRVGESAKKSPEAKWRVGKALAESSIKSPYVRQNVQTAARNSLADHFENQSPASKAMEATRYVSPIGAATNITKRLLANKSPLPVEQDLNYAVNTVDRVGHAIKKIRDSRVVAK